MRKVHCAKLNREALGLDFVPPGALGQKIYETISAEAWKQWLDYQTLLINEGRLNLANSEHRALLQTQMETFLFSNQAQQMPEAYISSK